MTVERADALDAEALADLFTAGYEGYRFPIRLDAQGFTAMTDMFGIDLGRSFVARGADGRPVGLVLLGVRGRTGWIGGMGVASDARRHGVGLTLMRAAIEEARAAGVDTLTLEVLEENAPAIALYERLGFRLVRMLEVWTLEVEPPASTAEPVPLETAFAVVRAHRRAREPWQRADETVTALPALEAVAVGDAGAALFRVAGERVALAQLGARDEDTAAQLLAAARARGAALSFVNVPEGDPASAALAQLGARLDTRQLEMALPLTG